MLVGSSHPVRGRGGDRAIQHRYEVSMTKRILRPQELTKLLPLGPAKVFRNIAVKDRETEREIADGVKLCAYCHQGSDIRAVGNLQIPGVHSPVISAALLTSLNAT